MLGRLRARLGHVDGILLSGLLTAAARVGGRRGLEGWCYAGSLWWSALGGVRRKSRITQRPGSVLRRLDRGQPSCESWALRLSVHQRAGLAPHTRCYPPAQATVAYRARSRLGMRGCSEWRLRLAGPAVTTCATVGALPRQWRPWFLSGRGFCGRAPYCAELFVIAHLVADRSSGSPIGGSWLLHDVIGSTQGGAARWDLETAVGGTSPLSYPARLGLTGRRRPRPRRQAILAAGPAAGLWWRSRVGRLSLMAC